MFDLDSKQIEEEGEEDEGDETLEEGEEDNEMMLDIDG